MSLDPASMVVPSVPQFYTAAYFSIQPPTINLNENPVTPLSEEELVQLEIMQEQREALLTSPRLQQDSTNVPKSLYSLCQN